MNIAFVTADNIGGYAHVGNLTPDDRIAVRCLENRNVQVTAAVWDDPTVPWKSYDHIVFRSCWDYHSKAEKFISWLDSLDKMAIQTWNPTQLIRWNLDKCYLRDLEKEGIPIPPSTWIQAGETPDLTALIKDHHWKKFVIKPTRSLGAQGAALFSSKDIEAAEAHLMSIRCDRVIQQYLPEISSFGEVSLVFINGVYSHSILKCPAKDDFRVQLQFGGVWRAYQASDHIITQAQRALSCVSLPHLYARVDGTVVDKTFVVIELELIEPILYFEFDESAANRFANAILELRRKG